jgi:SAM-dependent MidA family methyltransferase
MVVGLAYRVGERFNRPVKSVAAPTPAGRLTPSRPAETMMGELESLLTQTGPITFDRYLQLVLYHPLHGYYANRVPGKGVSYETSASIGPEFGEMVAVELRAMWEALGRPDPFTVTEFGAGLAGLAEGAIRSAGPLLHALRWRIVEQFDSVARMQRDHLGPAARHVEWISSLEGPPTVGCVLGNEVLDNFPFHRFRKTDGRIQEVFVGWRDNRLVELVQPPSSEEMISPVLPFQAQLNEGDSFEIRPQIGDWCRAASAALSRGYLLVVDYGDEEPDIWLRGPRGTVATYSGEGGSSEPLEEPGLKDITADVDFSDLDRGARAAGLNFELLSLQSYWLASLGAGERASQLEAEAQIAEAFGWRADSRVLEGSRSRLLRLTDPAGLGGCLVYRASKGF